MVWPTSTSVRERRIEHKQCIISFFRLMIVVCTVGTYHVHPDLSSIMDDIDGPLLGIREISVALRKALDREKTLKSQFSDREQRHKEALQRERDLQRFEAESLGRRLQRKAEEVRAENLPNIVSSYKSSN